MSNTETQGPPTTSAPPSLNRQRRRWLAPLALAASLAGCGSEPDEPSLSDFHFDTAQMEQAVSGTYAGTITPQGGQPSPLTVVLRRDAPAAGSTTQAIDPGASGAERRPLCGSVSRDMLSAQGTLSVQCVTMYTSTMAVVGTASSDLFTPTQLVARGTYQIEGATLPGYMHAIHLSLSDGTLLEGSQQGDGTLGGRWSGPQGQELGAFELTKPGG